MLTPVPAPWEGDVCVQWVRGRTALPSQPSVGPTFGGLFSDLALVLTETPTTFLKMVVMGRSESWTVLSEYIL